MINFGGGDTLTLRNVTRSSLSRRRFLFVDSRTVHWMRSADVGPHPAGWAPSGIADFNNDGNSDLAWYNPGTNGIDIWKLTNGQWAGSADTGMHPAGYQPAGFGDFNADGTDDILWFNPTTRNVDIWKIANGLWAGSVDVGTHGRRRLAGSTTPAGSSLARTSIGDGTSDIAWYNPSTNNVALTDQEASQGARSRLAPGRLVRSASVASTRRRHIMRRTPATASRTGCWRTAERYRAS